LPRKGKMFNTGAKTQQNKKAPVNSISKKKTINSIGNLRRGRVKSIKPSKGKEILKILDKVFSCEVRKGRGDHFVVTNPKNGKIIQIPAANGHLELDPGFINNALRSLRIDKKEFSRYLHK
jgi:hypothetical protein